MSEDNENFRVALGGHWRQLKKRQRVAFITLILSAVLLFFVAFVSVKNAIESPFRVSLKQLEENKSLLKDPLTEQEAASKRTDTDGDGLSDWDEENTYKTSPYLWSTAGDNVPDNVKIALGENPLCKHGEKCTTSQMRFNLETSTSPLNSLTQGGNAVNATLNQYLLGSTPEALDFQSQVSSTGVNLDWKSSVPREPELLRRALIDSGKVTKEELDTVSDEELLRMFDEAVVELEQKQAEIPGSSAPSGI